MSRLKGGDRSTKRYFDPIEEDDETKENGEGSLSTEYHSTFEQLSVGGGSVANQKGVFLTEESKMQDEGEDEDCESEVSDAFDDFYSRSSRNGTTSSTSARLKTTRFNLQPGSQSTSRSGSNSTPTPVNTGQLVIRQSTLPELRPFSGRNASEDKARIWLSRVKSAFRRDQLDEIDKCSSFHDLLEGPARDWYKQLPRTSRLNWDRLREAFREMYCGKSVSEARRYYDMRRGSNEDPLDYLHRLNVQANNAKIKTSGNPFGREHVEHFIDTLEDEQLAKVLIPMRIHSKEELQGILMAMRKHEKRKVTGSKAESKADTKNGYKSKMKKEPAEYRRKVAMAKYRKPAISSESEWEEASSSELSSEEDSDSDQRFVRFHEGRMRRVAYQSREKKPSRTEIRMDKAHCSSCGSQNHEDEDCWRKVRCEHCNRLGHPTRKCFRICRSCGEVHEDGECKHEELWLEFRKWYDPTIHAGLLSKKLEDIAKN